MTVVALGPLRYEVVGALPPFLRARAVPGETAARRIEVSLAQAFPRDAADVHGAAVRALPDRDEVYLPAGKDPSRTLHGPLAQLVARDLAALDGLLLHASAVRVAGGVALLAGAPGAGKTTLAGWDPSRAFAGNAVCARRAGERWVAEALPFASDPRPDLDAGGEAEVAAIVELGRAGSPSLEWASGHRATVIVARACVTPVLADPWRRRRAAAILDLAASVGIASLGATGTRDDLDLLDRSLNLRAHG